MLMMSSVMEVAAVTETPENVQRWTAKRRSALVLSIIKGETSVAEAARKHGLTVAEVELEDSTPARRDVQPGERQRLAVSAPQADVGGPHAQRQEACAHGAARALAPGDLADLLNPRGQGQAAQRIRRPAVAGLRRPPGAAPGGALGEHVLPVGALRGLDLDDVAQLALLEGRAKGADSP